MSFFKRICEGIRKGVHQISTPPNRTSYYWKDSVSVLSWIVLHAIYLVRVLSLLQIGKYIYRLSDPSSKDPASKRPNVPSWVVELYFGLVLCLMTVASQCLNVFPCWLKVCAYYFFIDSTVWVLYYFFFRRFFEEKYAIMHFLEYIVVLPLVILSQAMEIIIITDRKYSLGESFSRLLNPNVDTPVPILLVSVLYVAVIFGLIISNLPLENIKERGNYHYHLLVIGYGEVVKKKLQKALRAHFVLQKRKPYFNVAYYDPRTIWADCHEHPFRRFHEHFYHLDELNERKKEDFKKDILRSNIVWIATPPSQHFRYLEHYCRTNTLVVVEKPVTVYRKEFEAIKILRQAGLDNVFHLSYYILEKALPLTFLYRPLEFFEKYLDFNGATRQELFAAFSALGMVRSIKVDMIEEDDPREWAFLPEEGGQLFETFIHPLCIAQLVLGMLPPAIRPTGSKDASGRVVDISLSSSFAGYSIILHMRKQASLKKRFAELQYVNGTIHMDMDTRELIMTQNGAMIARISIKKPYSTDYGNDLTYHEILDNYKSEYSIQLDMVLRCFGDRIAPSTIDCSDIQFDVMDWLFQNR